MSRFLETFAQISFLAIFAEAEKDIVAPPGSPPGSLCSSPPSCLVSLTSDFPLEKCFGAFSFAEREKEKRKEVMIKGRIKHTSESHVGLSCLCLQTLAATL